MPFLGKLMRDLEKNMYCQISNQHLSIFQMQSFMLKKKVEFRSKIALCGHFGLRLGKTIVIFDISNLQICQNAEFHVKVEKLNLE